MLYPLDKVSIHPKGHLYEKFIIEEVKSYVDSVFRTKSDPEHTALMGSSRGGQVTYHIGFRNPDIFGKLAIVSPYFYCVDPIPFEEIRLYHTFISKQPLSQIWIDLGSTEGTLVMLHIVNSYPNQRASSYVNNKVFTYGVNHHLPLLNGETAWTQPTFLILGENTLNLEDVRGLLKLTFASPTDEKENTNANY